MWVKWSKVLIKCYFICEAKKKLTVLSGFTWFLIVLGKIEDGGQDGDHIWWCHSLPAAPSPIKYTSFCREDQKLSTEGKIVSKCWNIKNSRVSRTVGVWFCVNVRGLIIELLGKLNTKRTNRPYVLRHRNTHFLPKGVNVYCQVKTIFINSWHYCYMFKNLTNFEKKKRKISLNNIGCEQT